MVNPKSDIDELKNLQREAREQRAKRKKPRPTPGKTEDQESAAAETRTAAKAPAADSVSEAQAHDVEEDSSTEEQAHETEEAIQDLAGQIETAVTKLEETASERPVLALLAAFSLGIIVGQLFSRR